MKTVLCTIVTVFFAGIFSSGGFAATEESFKPRKIQVDTNHDGKVDRVEVFDRDGNVMRVEADTTGDGKTDEWIYYTSGKPVKSEKDTNADGTADVWMEY